ncbi:hypothetical protein ELE36_17270 [Pseudolysobacter antarcticus]|uniref:Uncharacterized protein n=2 Tax=Pseudolysobacter antarcticus TaxID=2511995 RepID=A0A411HNC7_9GAMM|nr:hypothetical protein ELE36_17270 [Pseudolysobacter antarcticus]
MPTSPDSNPTVVPRAAASAQDTASLIAIIVANAFVIGIAFIQHWPLGTLLWPYWIQSVVIGIFNFRRMWLLKNFSSAGMLVNGSSVSATSATAKFTAGFFALHYGGFHLVYLFFLFAIAPFPHGQGLWILLAAATFGIGQYHAYRQHLIEDARGESNIGALMATPYLRILPMHLVIMLGAILRGSGWILVLFGVLKTAAEIFGIRAERKMLAKIKDASEAVPVAPTP